MSNPLLRPDHLPAFADIRPEHVSPALDTLLADADAALERAVGPDVPADYDAVSAVLDVAVERLGFAWGAVNHLNSVADSPALREAYNENLARMTDFHTRMGSDERLYARYKAIAADDGAPSLSPARVKALSNALRDFRLSGAELSGAARERFAQIQDRLAELGQRFGEHVLDATDRFAHYATEAELDGVPDDVKAAARTAAQVDGRDGFKVTLHFPSYYPVMQYGTHRPLRQALYTAYVTRASDLGPPELDNTAVLAEILQLRQEEARLLGFGTYADLSLVPKMATSPNEVIAFLRDLARRARPHAQKDLAELRDFAATELGLPELQAWDIAFASERLKKARYDISAQELKPYFTEPQVLDGMFRIAERLFEVSIRPDQASLWHDSVRFFRVERNGSLLAQFFLDPYARPGKRPGAWMGDVRVRWARPEGRLQTPVAHLVCNFSKPVGDKPALLTHDDVTTLFHEFGHGLHLMLTQVDDIGVSGLSGVEWDAVELPSQFMENFCWEWEVLQQLTAHVDSGLPLPRALFDRMVAARNFQSGLATVRSAEYGLFDMRIHTEPEAANRALHVAQDVHDDIGVTPVPAFNRYPNSFSHVFDGGYAAGYYSYEWADVLSADAWSLFEERGALDVEAGRRLRQEILEVGGSRTALDNFKAFRGREPTIDAMLRQRGIA